MKYTAQDIARILNATAQIEAIPKPTLQEKLRAFSGTFKILAEISNAANESMVFDVAGFRIILETYYNLDRTPGRTHLRVDEIVNLGYKKIYVTFLNIYFNWKKNQEPYTHYVYVNNEQYEIVDDGNTSNNEYWIVLLAHQDEIIEATIAAVSKINANKVALINAVKQLTHH